MSYLRPLRSVSGIGTMPPVQRMPLSWMVFASTALVFTHHQIQGPVTGEAPNHQPTRSFAWMLPLAASPPAGATDPSRGPITAAVGAWGCAIGWPVLGSNLGCGARGWPVFGSNLGCGARGWPVFGSKLIGCCEAKKLRVAVVYLVDLNNPLVA